jgi:hypothetical protein
MPLAESKTPTCTSFEIGLSKSEQTSLQQLATPLLLQGRQQNLFAFTTLKPLHQFCFAWVQLSFSALLLHGSSCFSTNSNVCLQFFKYYIRWAYLHHIDSLHSEWKHHDQVSSTLPFFLGGLESYIFLEHSF